MTAMRITITIIIVVTKIRTKTSLIHQTQRQITTKRKTTQRALRHGRNESMRLSFVEVGFHYSFRYICFLEDKGEK